MLLTNIFCSYRSHMGCNKEFNRPDKLKAHILSHSGECSWPLPMLLAVGSEVAVIPCGCVGVWYGSKPEKQEKENCGSASAVYPQKCQMCWVLSLQCPFAWLTTVQFCIFPCIW